MTVYLIGMATAGEAPDHFVTLVSECSASLRVERSEFTAIAFPAPTEGAFTERLDRERKASFEATHHCWAYRLFDQNRVRSSDDGEPAGTAGRPILAAIESAGLHDTGVIVVRYFGGVKLGTGGLSRAYRDAARAVLAEAPRVEQLIYETVEVEVPFANLSDVYRWLDPPHVLLEAEQYGDVNTFTFRVRRSRLDAFVRLAAERRLVWRVS